MKAYFTFAFWIMLLTFSGLNAQNHKFGKKYLTRAFEKNSPISKNGFLTQVLDSSVVISYKTGNSVVFTSHQEIPVQDIDYLRFNKDGGVGGPILLGALAGLGAGFIIGYSMGEDKNCSLICYSAGTKGGLIGIPMALGGGIIGGFIGVSSIKKIIINKNQKSYEDQKGMIRIYQRRY